MKLTLLSSATRMAKKILGERTENPPIPALWSSYEVEVPEDPRALMTEMKQAGDKGHAIACGGYTRSLKLERRAGKADPTAPFYWVCVDVDGYPSPFPPAGKLTAKDTTKAAMYLAKKVVGHMPAFAQASASHGVYPSQLRLHLFYMLSTPQQAGVLRAWLETMNYGEGVVDTVELAPSGMSPKYPVDPSLGQSGRLLFTAPPECSDEDNPYGNNEDRWVYIGGKPITPDPWPRARIHEAKKNLINGLRKAAGLTSKRKPKIKLKGGPEGEVTEILQNPEALDIEVADDTHSDYVRCNVNGGNSRAYYFLRDDPALMRNFKGEPYWPIEIACPDFALQIPGFRRKTAKGGRLQPAVFRDYTTDTVYAMLVDDATGDFDPAYGVRKLSKSNAWDFLSTHGALTRPETYPDAELVFDPTAGEEIPELPPKRVPGRVNVWRPTSYRRETKTVNEAPGLDNLQPFFVRCPTIARLTMHALGGDREATARFLNWVAYIWQTGEKTQTAWVVTGAEGTGKGLLCHRVLQPLFRYVTHKQMSSLEEKFNDYMEKTQILVVDEFRYTSAGRANPLAERIKVQITEPTVTIRAMQSDQTDKPSYLNFIFYSNHLDAVQIPVGDRRFNVSPFQESPLRDALGQDKLENIWLAGPEKPGSIASELGQFASLLDAFLVEENRARTPLENSARDLVQKMTSTSFDDLAEAMRNGELEYFLPISEMSLGNVFGADLAFAKQSVETFLADAAGDGESVVPIEHLRRAYNLISERDHQIGTRKFRTELAKRRLSVNARKRVEGSHVRGIRVIWSKESRTKAQEIISGEGCIPSTSGNTFDGQIVRSG